MAIRATRSIRAVSPALIRQARSTPLLGKTHELALARRWREKGDETALKELTGAYLRMVLSVANRHAGYGLPVDDLVQEGAVGLMEAARRFEPEREIRFSTYAAWWVRSAMQDFILRNWSIVRTGTTAAHKALFFRLRALRAKIEKNVDGPLSARSRRRIAEALAVREKDVDVMAARLAAVDRSLNAPAGSEDAVEWQDLLRDEALRPEEKVIRETDARRHQARLSAAMDRLSARERTIIRGRRLQDDKAITLARLGAAFGISKERVRQIENQALEKLRSIMTCAPVARKGAATCR